MYSNLDGNPIDIVNNAGDEKGEHSLVRISIEAIQYFVHIKPPADFSIAQVIGDNLKGGVIREMKWTGKEVASLLMPIIFRFYLGDVPVYEELYNNKTKTIFEALGSRCQDWVTTAMGSICDHGKSMDVIGGLEASITDKEANVKCYVDKDWDGETARKLAANGPMGKFAHVQSGEYPQ